MWTSVSGLLVHGEKMNVIGNNISNVNTVGFKAQRMDFQDYVYQYMGTANGMGQVGRGTSIGIIMNDFDQGALETTTDATDIAITGNGFFAVKPKTNQTTYYTRAGNFRFDKDGFLVDPHGYVLQGWKIDREFVDANTLNRSTGGIVGTGPVTDIRLDTFTCPPRHTTEITLPLNLKSSDATANDKSQDVTDPFFAMLKRWNASDPKVKPLGDSSYAHQSTMEVYDEGGRLHTLTIYFDRVTNSDKTGAQHIANDTPSEIYWEFLVTMDPADDVRDFSTIDPNAISTTANVPAELKGILGAGTITFSSDGIMKDMSCFVPANEPWWDAGNNVDLTKFVSAPISQDGFPLIAPNFSGAPGQASAYGLNSTGTKDYTQPNQYAGGRLIALDFGLRTTVNDWSFPSSMATNGYGGMAAHSASALAANTLVPISTTTTTTRAINPANSWVSTTTTATTTRTITPSNSWISTTTPTPTTRTITPAWIFDGSDWVPDQSAAPAGMTYSGAGNIWTAVAGLTPDPALWIDNGNGTYSPIPQAAQPTTEDVIIDVITWNPNPASPPAGMSYSGGVWTAAAGFTPDATLWSGPVGGAYTPITQTAKPTSETVTIATTTWAPDTNNPPDGMNWSGTAWTADPGFTPDSTLWTNNGNGTYTPRPQTAQPVNETVGITTITMEPAADKQFGFGFDGKSELLPTNMTCHGEYYYEHPGKRQDGYTYGDLRYVNVSTDGVLSASYSNGVTLQLFQLTLYDFPSKQNLRREGGNLFTETRESGIPSSGAAGTGVFGTTQGYSIEQSNADLAREFVNMITTQRGFQANSKSITTVDTMLETVIQMKR